MNLKQTETTLPQGPDTQLNNSHAVHILYEKMEKRGQRKTRATSVYCEDVCTTGVGGLIVRDPIGAGAVF